ncbi:hypothetical protein ACFV24_08165 [Nocardia fluminea]|uniref:hypothetical protein n=1 Tax=Nocardia fluminea TaxID=134984 RepID=UPI0033DB22B5
MTDPHQNTVGTAPVSLFSSPDHSDASSESAEPVPGNHLPTFLAAAVEDQDQR